MKKNITINLCGRLFQIDEDAYELLQQSVVLQARQQRVERSLHHEQLGLLQLLDDVTGIRRPMLQEQQDAVLEHPLSHL